MWIPLILMACTEPEEVYVFADLEEVEFQTTAGTFVVEVDAGLAPETQYNFLVYVEDGFYDGSDGGGPTIFHRVVADFVVQGGGELSSGTRKPTREKVINESDNGALNVRGSVAMARSNNPDSAKAQFFVNLLNNTQLDATSGANGYTVFGGVIEGMEVIDTIAAMEVDELDRPLEDVVVESAQIR